MSKDRAHAASGSKTCRTLYSMWTVSNQKVSQDSRRSDNRGSRSHDDSHGRCSSTHLRWKQCDRSSMAHVGPRHCGNMLGRNKRLVY